MTEENEWELLGRIPRDSKNEWKVTKGNYWKIDVIDIRLHNNDKPTKKGIRLNLEEIKVLPTNFNVVKALLGDNSDNLPGVKGLGIKTIYITVK